MSYQANKWTQDELDTVSDMFKNGKSYDEIHKSKKVSRSAYAIECKLVNMVNDEIQTGKSHKEVAKLFNREKAEIKNMEAKAFEIKNKSAVNTQYTNDGGYEYKKKSNHNHNLTGGDKSNLLDLSEFQHINRVVGTVANFYENISRLNKLKDDDIIDEKFYKQLMKRIKEFTFDKDKILQSIDMSNYNNDNSNNDGNNNNDGNDNNVDDKNSCDTKSKHKEENKQEINEETKTLTKKKYAKRII
jgi:hypothetical protein